MNAPNRIRLFLPVYELSVNARICKIVISVIPRYLFLQKMQITVARAPIRNPPQQNENMFVHHGPGGWRRKGAATDAKYSVEAAAHKGRGFYGTFLSIPVASTAEVVIVRFDRRSSNVVVECRYGRIRKGT